MVQKIESCFTKVGGRVLFWKKTKLWLIIHIWQWDKIL